MNENRRLVDKIFSILEDKKALDIKIMDINEKSTIADHFIIATGTSNTHIQALAQEVVYQLKKENILPKSQEGIQTASWILLDYEEVIVHIFSQEMRKFYNIENLWGNMSK